MRWFKKFNQKVILNSDDLIIKLITANIKRQEDIEILNKKVSELTHKFNNLEYKLTGSNCDDCDICEK